MGHILRIQPSPSFTACLCSSPKGEADGAVRQVAEPADVQMGHEHLRSQPFQVPALLLPKANQAPTASLPDPFPLLPPSPIAPCPPDSPLKESPPQGRAGCPYGPTRRALERKEHEQEREEGHRKEHKLEREEGHKREVLSGKRTRNVLGGLTSQNWDQGSMYIDICC